MTILAGPAASSLPDFFGFRLRIGRGARVPGSVAVDSTGKSGGGASTFGGGADGFAACGGKEGGGALSGSLALNLNFEISPPPSVPGESPSDGVIGFRSGGTGEPGDAAGTVRGRNLMTGADSISSPGRAARASGDVSGFGADGTAAASVANRGFILRRGISEAAAASEFGDTGPGEGGGGGNGGGGAPLAGDADGRGFSFSGGGTSLMPTTKTVSRRH